MSQGIIFQQGIGMDAVVWDNPVLWDVQKIEPAPELIEVQYLMAIPDDDRVRLRQDILDNGIREPLRGYCKDMVFYILAGLNRFDIARSLDANGLRRFVSLPVVAVREGLTSREDRISFAIGDNLNRRHFDAAQKRNLVRYFLQSNPDDSNNSISKKSGVSDKTVATVRKKMESTSEIPKLKSRKGADGKERPATRKSTHGIATPQGVFTEETPEQRRKIALTTLQDYLNRHRRELMEALERIVNRLPIEDRQFVLDTFLDRLLRDNAEDIVHQFKRIAQMSKVK